MIAFWVLATFLIASAVWTIAARKPVYSVVALLLNFAALAILYVTLSAEFLAVIQIIVYSGAILVLFVFVIALLSSGVAPFAAGPNRLPKIWVPAGILVAASLGFLIYALAGALMPAAPPTGPVGKAGVFGSVADFGKALFTVHLLPFEVTALILMVAVIGVITLRRADARGNLATGAGQGRPRDARGDPARGQGIMPVPIGNYVALASVMFFIGVTGVIVRRNPLVMLMSIELMFNAANLLLIAFARLWLQNVGHIFAFLVITVAAAEAAIGLAIIVTTFRSARFVDVDEIRTLRG